MKWIIVFGCLVSAADAQSVLYRVDGTLTDQGLGSGLAVIGDTDADGVDDILTHDAGAGGSDGGFRVISGATGATRFAVLGSDAQALMAWDVSRLGDVDGDARADFLVDYMPSTGGSLGSVSVRSGADGSELHAFSEALGLSPFDAVDDVDGDGIADYIVGDSSYPNGSNAGRVWVRSGADSSSIQVYAYAGPGTDFQLGRSVAGLGDLDADGRGDFAYSALDAQGVVVVRVRSGRTGTQLFALHATANEFEFASPLVRAGDLDGDGTPDLLLGYHPPGGNGRARAVSGATGQTLYDAFGLCEGSASAPFNEYFAVCIAPLGDMNADGFDDFGASPIYGSYANVFSGFDGGLLARLQQPATPNTPGVVEISGGSDLNGDGRPDVVVGGQTFSPPPMWLPYGVGRVTVYSDIHVAAVGTKLGFGDGTGAPCPCGNTGQAGAGCANSSGLGAVLDASGHTSVALDDLFFEATNLRPIAKAMLIASPNAHTSGFGIPFGDGVLVCSSTVKRVWPATACYNGNALWGTGLQPKGLWGAGESRVFQVWYRDFGGPCGTNNNFTNGVLVTFTP